MRYAFEHFLVNGAVTQAPNGEITLELPVDVTLQAVYIAVTPKVILTYTSDPVSVNATINGQPVPSGSSMEFDEGSVVTIAVPMEVEV